VSQTNRQAIRQLNLFSDVV